MRNCLTDQQLNHFSKCLPYTQQFALIIRLYPIYLILDRAKCSQLDIYLSRTYKNREEKYELNEVQYPIFYQSCLVCPMGGMREGVQSHHEPCKMTSEASWYAEFSPCHTKPSPYAYLWLCLLTSAISFSTPRTLIRLFLIKMCLYYVL